MSIFKREQEPPYNRAATTKPAAAPPAPAVQPRESASPTPAAVAAATAQSGVAVQTGQPPVSREAAAVVDRKTEITGTLHSSGNVLIEGRFHGEVEASDTVWIEQGAQSDGQLRASAAVISGAADGQIECARRLQIAASAVVSGEIKTPVLIIEDGATVNCRFAMTRTGTDGGKR